jgi:hypothetical protein
MRRTGLLWAAAIVVIANAGAWGAAAANRRGEPEAVLELSERELRLPAKQAENTALTLSLVFGPPRARDESAVYEAGWFDRVKLESIGFDCRRTVTADNAEYYRTRIPRSTFAALELLDTPAPGPRLAAIDVENDPADLRARHPDRRRVAVVEATAALRYIANPGQPPFLMGQVTSVLPGEIHVPLTWRSLLTPLQSSERVTRWPPPWPGTGAHDPAAATSSRARWIAAV